MFMAKSKPKHGEPKREHSEFQNPHKPATKFGQTQKTPRGRTRLPR